VLKFLYSIDFKEFFATRLFLGYAGCPDKL